MPVFSRRGVHDADARVNPAVCWGTAALCAWQGLGYGAFPVVFHGEPHAGAQVANPASLV